MKQALAKRLDMLLKNTGDMCLKRRAKLLLTDLNPQKTDTILDAGCGDGYYLYLLSYLGDYRLYGIEYLKKNIDNAKRQVSNKKIHYTVGDIQHMPYKNNQFNKIVLSEVLEHVSSDYNALKELKRVMKKNGTLHITVPHINYPFLWDPINYILLHVFHTHIKAGFWAGVWNMHDRLYSVPELKSVVKKAGLKIEKVECLTHYGLPFNHYLTNIGFRMRTSQQVPKSVKSAMTKFSPEGKDTWFSTILRFINWLDQRNNQHFSPRATTVGIYLRARKP